MFSPSIFCCWGPIILGREMIRIPVEETSLLVYYWMPVRPNPALYGAQQKRPYLVVNYCSRYCCTSYCCLTRWYLSLINSRIRRSNACGRLSNPRSPMAWTSVESMMPNYGRTFCFGHASPRVHRTAWYPANATRERAP